MIDVSELNSAIESFLKEIDIDVVTVQKKITFDLLAGVVRKSPVDQGDHRQSWQVTISGIPKGNSKRKDPVTAGMNKLDGLKPFSLVYLTNNAPHASVIEFGLFEPANPGPTKQKNKKGRTLVREGFSTQAPQGTVRITIEEITQGLKND